jgi:hypothetical protein
MKKIKTCESAFFEHLDPDSTAPLNTDPYGSGSGSGSASPVIIYLGNLLLEEEDLLHAGGQRLLRHTGPQFSHLKK